MTFVDRAEVELFAGPGGAGVTSFRREKFVPKGGPDGGDGGKGGSVIIRADPQLSTLLDYTYKASWKADRGMHGSSGNKTGRSGNDLILPVPAGTVVRDLDSGDMLGETVEPGDEFVLARGGRGGRGNSKFATATHQTPTESEPGGPGEFLKVEFVLKLIADVGLLGEPNAGKSTLLSVISAAHPKIADYPFTTLEPQLGVAELSSSRTLVVADIPGIIEGAHAGKGLGDRFLQHVERTKVLAYMIPADALDVNETYELLRQEVREYSPALAEKPHVVVFTKMDLWPDDLGRPELDSSEGVGFHWISAVTHAGLEEFKELGWGLAHAELDK
jgi:GTP-binding protein